MNLNEINSTLNKILKEKIKEISNKFLINAKYNIQKNISRPVITDINNKRKISSIYKNNNSKKRKYLSKNDKYKFIFNHSKNEWIDDNIFKVSIDSIKLLFEGKKKEKFEFKRSFRNDFIIETIKINSKITHFEIQSKKFNKDQLIILYKNK